MMHRKRPDWPRSVCAVVASALIAGTCSGQPDFDLVIRGGTLYDGTGEMVGVRRADVGISGDRIRQIGNLSSSSSANVIDATGKIVAPGFIDAQSRSGVTLLADGFGESHLRQGITSELLGANSPAFWSAATADRMALERLGLMLDWTGINGYFAKLESRGTAINVGTLVPLSLARAAGNVDQFIGTAMREGALGVIDDVGTDASALDAAARAAARSGTVLTMPAMSPLTTSDDLFFGVASAARRVVVTRVEEQADDFLPRLAAAGSRNIAAYATVVPYGSTWRSAFGYGGVFVATDTPAMSASAPGDALPASFGAFPRLLGQLVRDDRAMELREAVRRSTSTPASIFGLTQRGILRENYFADIVVFDDNAIADRTTVDKPNEYAAGIEWVVVNGVVELTPRGLTGSRAGTRLLRPNTVR